eukprot:2107964-Alexandrium_andersonii.AAC.1
MPPTPLPPSEQSRERVVTLRCAALCKATDSRRCGHAFALAILLAVARGVPAYCAIMARRKPDLQGVLRISTVEHHFPRCRHFRPCRPRDDGRHVRTRSTCLGCCTA